MIGRTRTQVGRLAGAALLLSIAAGCGGQPSDRGGIDRTHEFLARASSAVSLKAEALPDPDGGGLMDDSLAYMDVAGARQQLGLPTDAFAGHGRPGRLLRSLASVPLFRAPLVARPTLGPVGEVLDGAEIDLVVSTAFGISPPGSGVLGPFDVAVVQTRQPFSEIDRRLRDRGYEEFGDGLLVGRAPIDDSRGAFVPQVHDEFPFPAVGDAGDGAVVLAGSPRAALAALAGKEAKLTTVARMLARLPGVSRVGDNNIEARPNIDVGCVHAVGLGEDARPRAGVLEIVISGDVDPDRALQFPTSSITNLAWSGDAQIVFGKAQATGEGLRIGFRSADREHRTLLAIEGAHAPYECGRSGP